MLESPRRIVAALAVTLLVLIGGGIFALTGQANNAEAHTADIKVSAACVSGEYQLTYTLTLANVPSGVTATVEARTGNQSFQNGWNRSTWNDWQTKASGVPSTQATVTWQRTLPGTTTGNGPWEYAVSTFSNGHVVKSDTRVEGLKGDCTGPKVTIVGTKQCVVDDTYTITWTVTISNFGSLSEVDLKAITWSPAGSLINGQPVQVWFYEWVEHHANHGLPPFPPGGSFSFTQSAIPGTATTASVTLQYDFKGGPSGDPEGTVQLEGDCTEAPIAAATVVKTDATCDVAETALTGTLANAELVSATGTTGPGTATFVFTRTGDALFPAGEGVSTDRTTKTISVVLGGVATTGCDEDTSDFDPPTFKDVCGVSQDSYTVPNDTTKVSYQVDDQRIDGVGLVVITVAAKGGYTIPDGVQKRWEHVFTDEACLFTVEDVGATCVDTLPYINWQLSAPEGFVITDPSPLTITISNGSNSVTLAGNYPLTGATLWPGAEVGPPKQWPGYVLDDGKYITSNDPAQFGWTREAGVTIQFSYNPTASAVLTYPAAGDCNPPPPPPDDPECEVGDECLADTGDDVTAPLTWGVALIITAGALWWLGARLDRRRVRLASGTRHSRSTGSHYRKV